jgi:hypothetical protein
MKNKTSVDLTTKKREVEELLKYLKEVKQELRNNKPLNCYTEGYKTGSLEIINLVMRTLK